MTRTLWWLCLASLPLACADGAPAAIDHGDVAVGDSSDDPNVVVVDTGSDLPSPDVATDPMDAAAGADVSDAADPDDPRDTAADLPDLPTPVACTYPAPNGPLGYREVDTYSSDVARVQFRLEALPDPGLVTQAVLGYTAYDADHPGAEGWIVINGGAPLPLPADVALDNAAAAFELDITGSTVTGVNVVEFQAFDSPDGSIFRISDLRVDVVTVGPQECPGEPDPPSGDGVERVIHYKDAAARFEQRRNWVLDCRDYAYTARFDEHRECDARYDPDGSGRGRAVFTFTGVVPDRYTVWVEGRHTGNRNPEMMLVVVQGVERRINQRDEAGLVWDLHGEHDLAGDVTVVIDSTPNSGSDSVRSVRITPVR